MSWEQHRMMGRRSGQNFSGQCASDEEEELDKATQISLVSLSN